MARHYLEEELINFLRTDDDVFHFLEESALDGIWFWDLESPEDEWMSPKFWTTFGYDPEEKKHKAVEWKEMIHPYDLERASENLQKHLDDPSHPYDQTVRYQHKDGSTVWVRCRGIAIRDDDGKPIRMLGAHNNVTQFTEYKQTNFKLLKANENLTAFVRASSHDLNAPLRTLQGQLTFISDHYLDNLDDIASRLLSDGLDTVSRMQAIVEGLGTYARMEQEQSPDSVTIDVQELLEGILKDFGADIDEMNAEINIGYIHNIQSSSELVATIFRNLISNALVYRSVDRSPVISIKSERTDFETVFSVRDNGIGIPEDFRDQILTPFKRLHRWDKHRGSGLGLTLCQKAVETMNGRLWLESKEGKGTTFYFSIPIYVDQDER